MVNGGRFFVLIAEYTKNLAWLGGFLHRRIGLRNPDELIRTGNQKYAGKKKNRQSLVFAKFGLRACFLLQRNADVAGWNEICRYEKGNGDIVFVNGWRFHFVSIGIHISSSESGSAFLYLSPNTSKCGLSSNK